jgi:hypothetical protein
MFAFKGDYRMQCCISFLAVEVASLCFLMAFDPAERGAFWRLGDFAPCKDRFVLTDPIS